MSFTWGAVTLSPPEDNDLHYILFRCPVGGAKLGSTTKEEGHASKVVPEEPGYLGTGTLPCVVLMVARVGFPDS